LPRRERRPLVIQARQFASWDDGPWRTALILIDPDKPRAPNGGALCKAFGLTASEEKLALAIADGLELKTVAAARNVSEFTLRTQLKAVFAKTGTHRQAELAALAARFAIP